MFVAQTLCSINNCEYVVQRMLFQYTKGDFQNASKICRTDDYKYSSLIWISKKIIVSDDNIEGSDPKLDITSMI